MFGNHLNPNSTTLDSNNQNQNPPLLLTPDASETNSTTLNIDLNGETAINTMFQTTKKRGFDQLQQANLFGNSSGNVNSGHLFGTNNNGTFSDDDFLNKKQKTEHADFFRSSDDDNITSQITNSFKENLAGASNNGTTVFGINNINTSINRNSAGNNSNTNSTIHSNVASGSEGEGSHVSHSRANIQNFVARKRNYDDLIEDDNDAREMLNNLRGSASNDNLTSFYEDGPNVKRANNSQSLGSIGNTQVGGSSSSNANPSGSPNSANRNPIQLPNGSMWTPPSNLAGWANEFLLALLTSDTSVSGEQRQARAMELLIQFEKRSEAYGKLKKANAVLCNAVRQLNTKNLMLKSELSNERNSSKDTHNSGNIISTSNSLLGNNTNSMAISPLHNSGSLNPIVKTDQITPGACSSTSVPMSIGNNNPGSVVKLFDINNSQSNSNPTNSPALDSLRERLSIQLNVPPESITFDQLIMEFQSQYQSVSDENAELKRQNGLLQYQLGMYNERSG